jgi:hypothetical protein
MSNSDEAKWLQNAKKELGPIIRSRDFKLDVFRIHRLKLNEDALRAECIPLLKEYGLRTAFFPVVLQILKGGSVDYSLITPPAIVIKPENIPATEAIDPIGTPIYLEIAPNITKAELIDFIIQNWPAHILPALKAHGNTRARSRTPTYKTQKRVSAIMGKLKNGMTYQEIANELATPLGVEEITKIASRERKRRSKHHT